MDKPTGHYGIIRKRYRKCECRTYECSIRLLRDPDGLNLRDYQIRAIEAAEQAIISGKTNVLLSMATGTGKPVLYLE